MKLRKIHIKNEIKIGFLMLIAFTAIALTEKRDNERSCKAIHIEIENLDDNRYLTDNDIYQIMTSNESDFLLGSLYNRIDLRTIEDRILDNDYIEYAEAFTDFKGNLNLNVTLRKPIARILLNGQKDFYLDECGNLFPESEKYTSRVLLVDGEYVEKLVSNGFSNDKTNMDVLKLIQFINGNEFWKAQISQIEIDDDGDIIMYPQVTKQHIEFGKPVDIEKKFKKLEIFYKRILPGKGWNSYSRVNVQYLDQIICE